MNIEAIRARLAIADKETFWEDANSNLVFEDIPALLAEVERLQAERDKTINDMKYYLENNEESGVVYIPKFVVERIVKLAKEGNT